MTGTLVAGSMLPLAAPSAAYGAAVPGETVPAPTAPAAGVSAEVPGAGAEVELDTGGGLLDLSLFDELLPPPASEVVDGAGSAVGGVLDAGVTVPGAAGGEPAAEAPSATPTTATPAAGGTTTTTGPKGVVEDKGTGDSGYDENVGRKPTESPAKASSAAPAKPKPAAAPAKRAKGRFALSGADVGVLAAFGAALTGAGLIFRSARWRRPGRAGRSS